MGVFKGNATTRYTVDYDWRRSPKVWLWALKRGLLVAIVFYVAGQIDGADLAECEPVKTEKSQVFIKEEQK